jgi:isoleucyl-tRNA synthetase
MPYLKEAHEAHLSRDSMGQRLLYGDRHIVCQNSAYALRDNETEEVIETIDSIKLTFSMDLANKVKNGGTEYIEIGDTQIALTSENLLVTMQGKEGFAFAGEGEIGVVLDTTITPELKEEGYVREILSKVQNMRKDKGFEVLDKINLYVAENTMLEAIVKKYENEIMKETLTEKVLYNESRTSYTEVAINGEKLMLDVEVI